MIQKITHGIAKVHAIQDNLWAIDEIGRTTMYVYAGKQRVLLLDTGFGLLDLKQLVSALCPDREIVVVNTHAHGDHSSGNGQFSCVHVGQRDLLAAEHSLTGRETELFREHFLTVSPLLNAEQVEKWQPRAAEQTCPLQDGDIIDLGGIVLEVLETPGHTVGSICLWDAQNGLLFTGDMALPWGAWGHLPESATLEEYGSSIRRLCELGSHIKLLPAHGKEDNPLGWPMWHMNPCILEIYNEGIQAILSGDIVGQPYSCFLGDGRFVRFRIGGISYDPERMQNLCCAKKRGVANDV